MNEPRYLRIDDKVYTVDQMGNRWLFKTFESISKARTWAAEQNKKEPGTVTKVKSEPPPPAKLRQQEIAALTRAQAMDQTRDRSPQGPRPYVMPDKDSSSFLRARSARRNKSRIARNGRAGTGST